MSKFMFALLSIIKPIRVSMLAVAVMLTIIMVRVVDGMWVFLANIQPTTTWTIAGIVAIATALFTLLGVAIGGKVAAMTALSQDGPPPEQPTVPASTHDKLIEQRRI